MTPEWTLYGFIIQLLLLLAILGKEYYLSYSKQKGQNKAQMEDTAKLTKLMEEVRNELSFESKVKHSVYDESKVAVIKAFDALRVWFLVASNLHNRAAGYISEELADKHRRASRTAQSEYEDASTKLDLYFSKGVMTQLFSNAAEFVAELQKLNAVYIGAKAKYCAMVQDYEEKIEEFRFRDNIKEMNSTEEAMRSKKNFHELHLAQSLVEIDSHDDKFIPLEEEIKVEMNKFLSDSKYFDKK